jgi:hypothetical protein
MTEFVTATPPRSTNFKQTISPSKKNIVKPSDKDDKKLLGIPSVQINTPSKTNPFSSQTKKAEPIRKINKPSKTNPFSSRPKQSEEPDFVSRSSQRHSFTSIHSKKLRPRKSTAEDALSEENQQALALNNIFENSRYSDYDIDSDPNYETFHKWANDTKSDTNMESGLTVKKTNGTLPTEDELKYLSDIQPYLIAYKIYCDKFSTTREQLEKCYPMYMKIKELIDEYRDNGIKFYRGDRPNKELIYMPHFPIKTSKKAKSVEKSQRSHSIRKRETHSRGGKKRVTSKNRS